MVAIPEFSIWIYEGGSINAGNIGVWDVLDVRGLRKEIPSYLQLHRLQLHSVNID